MKPTGLVLIAALLLLPVIWLPGIGQGRDTLALFSQYLGLVALIAMAISHLIATRFSAVEAAFGPMDQSYRIHKWLGIGAMVAIMLHDVIDADMRGLGQAGPLEDVAETAGEISLNGLLIFLIITVATFIPYHLWKWTHRFIGVFFVLGAFHYLFILKPFSNVSPLGIYMVLVCTIGTLAFAYTVAPRHLRPSKHYEISKVEPAGEALAVEMAPMGGPLKHSAGQFAFFAFEGSGNSEPHPFTISAPPTPGGNLRVTIAPLGDFTIRLARSLAAGQSVRVDGPYGHFGRPRKAEQVWVAAGVGVTPFVALAKSLSEDGPPVKMIYCFRKAEDGPHLQELRKISGLNERFSLLEWESSTRGRLSAQAVLSEAGGSFAGKDLLFCGPTPMREALWDGLKSHGLSRRRFHYEAFEIRTGVGLKRLANWLWHRRDQIRLRTQ